MLKATLGIVLVSVMAVTSLSQDGFAQTPDPYPVGGDLTNDPIAQDILEKIEKTKRWIKQIEEREAAQKDIEEKRKQVLDILEKDLVEWQAEWEYFTFEYRFEQMKNKTSAKYLESNWQNNAAGLHAYNNTLKYGGTEQEAKQAAMDVTGRIHGIFLDNLAFTYSKIKDGQRAMKMVLDRGGTGLEAQNAYAQAAQMSIAELSAINAISNINNKMAYYNQQILFDAEGQFDYLKSGNLIREYYQDYRTIPAYILANPDDPSWKNIGKTDKSTECRIEHILVYRDHQQDYICTTPSTAEMWKRHNMGEIIEKPNPHDLTIEQLHNDRINSKIDNANKKLKSIDTGYINQINDMNQKYQEKFLELETMKLEEEKDITDEKHLLDIHNRYETQKDLMLSEKSHFKELFLKSTNKAYEELLDIYEDDEDLEIVWDSDQESYQAQRR